MTTPSRTVGTPGSRAHGRLLLPPFAPVISPRRSSFAVFKTGVQRAA
jgi:hypothetical protein